MNNENTKKELEQLGTFEISRHLLSSAEKNKEIKNILNAGQGDPNWINTKARLAFNRLVEFGIKESSRTINETDLAGYVVKEDISKRFKEFLNPLNQIDSFLLEGLFYTQDKLNLDEDAVVNEWANGVLGNNYPTPSRILEMNEPVLNAYLENILYKNKDLAHQTDVFPTEGGTAAIVYIFQSLKENHLIAPGDKIAINTPIFPPYLEIPQLNDYEMVGVDFQSKEEDHWQIDPEELKKVIDTDVKALFLVNPSNPGSKAFSKEVLDTLKEIVKTKPDLMIITDDVYGTFVDDFESVYGVLPYNTLLVYSFSKLFGAAGWRLGTIATNKQNIFDKKIAELDAKTKAQLEERYQIAAFQPSKLKFIDRIVADSRSIGLYHTSGLSTPQQMMEVLFALTHLVEQNKVDNYIKLAKNIISTRYDLLHDSLKMEKDSSSLNAKYYSLINIFSVAENLYDSEFSTYLKENYRTIDFLIELAEKKGIILAYGPGFDTPNGYLRVSEANLPTEDYKKIGENIVELLEEYHDTFKKK